MNFFFLNALQAASEAYSRKSPPTGEYGHGGIDWVQILSPHPFELAVIKIAQRDSEKSYWK